MRAYGKHSTTADIDYVPDHDIYYPGKLGICSGNCSGSGSWYVARCQHLLHCLKPGQTSTSTSTSQARPLPEPMSMSILYRIHVQSARRHVRELRCGKIGALHVSSSRT